MSQDNYNPNSIDAAVSRIETKLDSALKQQAEQELQLGKLWSAIGRIDVRVAAIAGGVSLTAFLLELWIKLK